MDSTLFLATFVALAIGLLYTLLGIVFFMLYQKFWLHQENKTIHSSSSLTPSSSSDSLSLNLKHQAFPSFHGADVRKSFLSHLKKEFRRKAIDMFTDNDIKKCKSIGPELFEAIRGSKIVIVILSRNYASSSWCLDELVEIIKCREEFNQTVMTLFYDVDPTDVRKQTGDFGKAFKKTCKGKTKENIQRWRHALAGAASITGYHSDKWDSEAAMIEKIATDISNKLSYSTPPSSDFDEIVGMEEHMEKLEPSLCLDANDVRMIGIWGPPGIGKTTIARYLYSKHSQSFDLSVFMDIKGYTRSCCCSHEHALKLELQKKFLSEIFDQKDIEVPHLTAVQDRLQNKRVLVILDDVDQLVQIEALAKENQWFGPGSRIIITTEHRRLLEAHWLKYIHKVDFPTTKKAFQIFCMNAFGQNSPKDGLEELARDAMYLAGIHPSGIKGMGCYFRGMSKQKWQKEMSKPKCKEALIQLRISPDSHNPMKKSRAGAIIINKKQEVYSRILSALNRKQIAAEAGAGAEADSGNLMRNSRIGIRVREKKHKILSHMVNRMETRQRVASKAEADRIYETLRNQYCTLHFSLFSF